MFYEMVNESRTQKSFVDMARGTRTFIAKELWELLEKFMQFMRNLPDLEGANYRAVYDKMTAAGLIKRLLTKRPIVFLNPQDGNVLRAEPLRFQPRSSKWNIVAQTLGNDGEVNLREYISYDEMILSALVNISVPTYFVSDGNKADAYSEPTKPFVPHGVLCGLVGARLEKRGFMEHRFVHRRSACDQNFFDVHHADAFWMANVYADAFPEGKIPTGDEVESKPEIYKNIYVSGINVVYLKKRLALSVVPFIEEAANRGMEKKQTVVASVPPIGAGVWRGSVPARTISDLIVTAVLEYLDNEFKVEKLEHLSALFLPKTDADAYSSFDFHNQIAAIKINSTETSIEVSFKGQSGRILTIFNQSRYVAQLLPTKFTSSLVVAGYAWDSNSYPGNEYWIDAFNSFDPQAALCSCIGQFQNPEVNVNLADPERIKIY